MIRFGLTMATGVLFLMGHFSLSHSQDWSQWRGPDRNGTVTSTIEFSENTRFESKWTANVGTGFSSVVVSQGKLVTMGNRDEEDIVTCLDSHTGEEIWTHRYAEPLDPNLFEGGPTSTPLIDGESVYTISRRGKIFSLQLATGEVNWEFDVVETLALNIPTWGFSGSPIRFEKGILFNVGFAGLLLDAQTGEVLWKSDNTEDAGYSSPVLTTVGETPVAILLSGKSMNAVRPRTGELLWSERWITRYGINAADPLLRNDGRLIVSSGYGKGAALYEFNANQAKEIWRNRELKNQLSPGLVIEDAVYAVDGDAGAQPRLVCLDPDSGQVLWQYAVTGSASVLKVADVCLLLEETGKLTVFLPNREKWNPITSETVNSGRCWTPPSFANSCLYTRNSRGDVVCSRVQ